MKPIGKYILLTPVKEEVKTESGILLSADDVDNIRYKKGTVNASGTDVNNIEKDLNEKLKSGKFLSFTLPPVSPKTKPSTYA